MAKYTFDVAFDIPQTVITTLPKDPIGTIKCDIALDRFDAAKSDDEYSELRISCMGSDSWCQGKARKLTIKINGTTYKAKGFEIVHCQG